MIFTGKEEEDLLRRRRPANHPFLQSVDWIAKGAAQRGRTEGAVLPVRRSAPKHDPYMTSEHSTTARWIRLGVNFEEGGNWSARRKPPKSGWDRLKLNPHTTFVAEVEGVIDVHYASLTSHGVQHRVFYLDGHPSRYQPRPTTTTIESFPIPSLKISGYFSFNVSLFMDKSVVSLIFMPTLAFLPSKGWMTLLSTSLQSSWHLKSSRHTQIRNCQLRASIP